MKILILSRNINLYSTNRLVEEAQKRGHTVEVINPLRCYMNISAKNPEIYFDNKKLSDFDAVIPRIGASITFYGTAVLRQFEKMGVFTVNSSLAITRSRDKLRSLQLLSLKGVGIPNTGFAHSPGDINNSIKMVGGAPLIIKSLEGTQGVGVVLAETEHAARSFMEAFLDIPAYIIVQEYIEEAKGSDIRCLVVGNKVIAAMQRQAQAGEFRSNIHRGGHAKLVKITPQESKMTIRAAKIMGLNVAGVDLIRSKRGPLIIEVNSSPGLEGIETATKKNVAGTIIKFIEKKAKMPRRQQG